MTADPADPIVLFDGERPWRASEVAAALAALERDRRANLGHVAGSRPDTGPPPGGIMSARPRLDGVLRAPVTRDEARIAVRRARARGTTVAAVLRAAAVEAGLLDDDHKPKLCPCCDQSANPSDAGR